MNNSELRRKNVIIGEYMKNTKFDDRETRCILLWSSKFFEHFNDIMRTYDLNRIIYETKWTRKYIKEILCYFKKNSKTKAYLQESRITRLYRGYAPTFEMVNTIIDNGFIATSTSKHVAENFARKDESFVVTFKVKDLSEDSIFLIVDDKVADHLQQDEVLFLPGQIEFVKKQNRIYALYKQNEMFLSMVGEMKGGKYDVAQTTKVEIPKTAFIDLTGKLVVWYRRIKNRPFEGMGFKFMPEDKDKVVNFFRHEVMPHENVLKCMTQWIPDYQDLKKKVFSNYKSMTEEESDRYASYEIHMAILDKETKTVLDSHYGVPKNVMNELGRCKKSDEKEIEKFLLEHYGWLMRDNITNSSDDDE